MDFVLNSLAINLRERCGLAMDRTIVVGVSGGPDSLCLLDSLIRSGYPLIAAHFDHHLRPESSQDAVAVEAKVRSQGVRFEVGNADVRSIAEKKHQSIEEAARNSRYSFLLSLAREQGAQAVAVGHTADDQVETMVMHFLRGSGLSGLRGMHYRTVLRQYDATIPVVRPLLDIWRDETVSYCQSRGLQPVYDRSNETMDYLRNKIRHELIPHLETYNPGIRKVLWRSTAVLEEDEKIIESLIENIFKDCVVSRDECTIEFDPVRLESQSAGITRNLLRHSIRLLDHQIDLEFDVLKSAADFIVQMSRSKKIGQGESKWITLTGGFILVKEQGKYYLSTNVDNLPTFQWPQLERGIGARPLRMPGSLDLPGNWNLTCELSGISQELKHKEFQLEDQFIAWLDKDSLTGSLELRTRRDGDRFQPLGMAEGTQKLSDFMVNEKMPSRARADWPLVCMGDQIIWVPGYRIGHPFRLHPDSQSAVVLKLEQGTG